MIVRGANNYSILVSLVALVGGILLIISGYVPFAVIGAGLILFSFLLPFLRLGIKPNPPIAPSKRTTDSEEDVNSSPTMRARREENLR